MSLVSCLSGTIAWNERASETEYRYNLLVEKINSIMDKSADLGEAISKIENGMSMNQNRIQHLQMLIANETNPAKKSQLTSLLNNLAASSQQAPQAKLALSVQKNQLDKKERKLQKEKLELDVRKKFAQQTAEAMEKMQDAAIKRLAIKA